MGGVRIRRVGRMLYRRVQVAGLGRRRGRRGRRAVTTRFARNGTVEIAYDVRGQGPPLVPIQGLGVGRWGWDPVVDRLARQRRITQPTLILQGTADQVVNPVSAEPTGPSRWHLREQRLRR